MTSIDKDVAKKTGRGFLVITIAKAWFMVTAAAIQLGLPILFGSAEQFGVFKIVTEAISLINMVMIAGTLHAVSKLVSEQPDRARVLVNMALKLQCLLGLPIAILYAVGSPWLASRFNDPSLASLMRISSLIIFFYAFYAIFVGYLNGIKEFVKQASLDITFSTLKTAGVLGLVVLGFGVSGAVWGFVGAAGIICLVAGLWTFALLRKNHPTKRAEASTTVLMQGRAEGKRLLSYLILIMLYTFALNGLMRADLFILKAVAADMPVHFIGAGDLFKVMSDKFAGFYGAVLNVARIPYQGVIAITFVIFPLISQSTFQDDKEKTQGYVRETFRYCLWLIGGVAMILAFNSDSIIAGLYSADYQNAAVALSILSVSIIFFALFYVATTMIIGAGYPLVAGIIMGISLVMSAILNYVFINSIHQTTMQGLSWTTVTPLSQSPTAHEAVHHAIVTASQHAEFSAPYLVQGTNYMQYAAIATTIAMCTGFIMAMAWLYRKFQASLPLGTVVRLCIAAGILYIINHVVSLPVEMVADYGKLIYLAMVVAKMAFMGIMLIVSLAATREFTSQDMARVKAVLGR